MSISVSQFIFPHPSLVFICFFSTSVSLFLLVNKITHVPLRRRQPVAQNVSYQSPAPMPLHPCSLTSRRRQSCDQADPASKHCRLPAGSLRSRRCPLAEPSAFMPAAGSDSCPHRSSRQSS